MVTIKSGVVSPLSAKEERKGLVTSTNNLFHASGAPIGLQCLDSLGLRVYLKHYKMSPEATFNNTMTEVTELVMSCYRHGTRITRHFPSPILLQKEYKGSATTE